VLAWAAAAAAAAAAVVDASSEQQPCVRHAAQLFTLHGLTYPVKHVFRIKNPAWGAAIFLQPSHVSPDLPRSHCCPATPATTAAPACLANPRNFQPLHLHPARHTSQAARQGLVPVTSTSRRRMGASTQAHVHPSSQQHTAANSNEHTPPSSSGEYRAHSPATAAM
jgi:hypothetical protein